MTNHRHDSEFEALQAEWLLHPMDLKEIMEDLRGELLTLEELALTLLDGGIELEYLETKYLTDRGQVNLLMVIACQDTLTVDWDDLSRRCGEVTDAVVADHLRREDPEADEELPPGEKPLHELIRVALEVHAVDPAISNAHGEELARAIALDQSHRKGLLLKGGVAPRWVAPDIGVPPLNHDRNVITSFDPNYRVTRDWRGFERVSKRLIDLLFLWPRPERKGMRMREYSRIVKEDMRLGANSPEELKKILRSSPACPQDAGGPVVGNYTEPD